MLQQPPGRPHTHQHPRILLGCRLHFLPHQRMYTPLHQEVGHQFQEAIGSWTETCNNPETPGHRRYLHLLAVPLTG